MNNIEDETKYSINPEKANELIISLLVTHIAKQDAINEFLLDYIAGGDAEKKEEIAEGINAEYESNMTEKLKTIYELFGTLPPDVVKILK